MKKLRHKCEGVSPKTRYHPNGCPCSFFASVEHDGKWLCKTHLKGAICQAKKKKEAADPKRIRAARLVKVENAINRHRLAIADLVAEKISILAGA